jgi:hypothetical protein
MARFLIPFFHFYPEDRGRALLRKFSTNLQVSTVLHLRSLWHRYYHYGGTELAQWLRYCATNRKVAGSIPDGVIGIFH